MNQLDAEDRALIDNALGHEHTSDEVRDRVHGRVLARIAAAAAGATVATTTATAAAGGAAGGTLSNLLIIVGLASLGAGAALVTNTLEEPAVVPTATVITPAAAVDSAPMPRAKSPMAPTPVTPRSGEHDQPVGHGGHVAQASSAPANAAAPQSSADSLQDEIALLQRAQKRLQAGDGAGALELLDEHKRAHHGGALKQERRAARVFALCKAGKREQARAAAARFLQESPESPLAARVRAACAD